MVVAFIITKYQTKLLLRLAIYSLKIIDDHWPHLYNAIKKIPCKIICGFVKHPTYWQRVSIGLLELHQLTPSFSINTDPDVGKFCKLFIRTEKPGGKSVV